MAGNVYTFCLPDIGEGIVEGEVVEWLKKVGDAVAQDEPVVVVMTDKATVELPSPYPGKISKHYYQPGEIALKDKPLYDIELSEGDVAAPQGPAVTETDQPKNTPKAKEVPKKTAARKNRHEKALAIPKVRKEAEEWELDLDQIAGTGPGGRVTEEDLHHALKQRRVSGSSVNQEGDSEKQLVGIRGLMARKMDETHIPQFSYFEQANATRLIQLRQNIREKAAEDGINLSFTPFFIRALSMTMKQFPQINASIDMLVGKVFLHRHHHIGIAMATPQGLIVPVLKVVETMGFTEVVHAYEELKVKANAGKLSAADMKGATLTMSNFGVLDGEGMWATPMISAPEVAILAVARMRKVPVVKSGEVVVGDMLPLSWSFDHRLIDGELAAEVSHYFSTLIKDPALLL